MLTTEALFPKGCFGDDDLWLRPRVQQMLEAAFAKPDGPFGAQFPRQAERQGAYRLCANPRISLPLLLGPALAETGRVLAEGAAGDTVLAIQDTTEINLSHLPLTQGLGELGNPKNRGLFLHTTLACTATGLPFGLLGAKTWVRDPAEHGKAEHCSERSFEAKESYRWWEALEAAEALANHLGRLLHVFDREGDVFQILARASASRFRLLVRAAQNRCVDSPQEHLWETVEALPPRGQRTVWIPPRPALDGRPARPGRLALLTLRFGPVTVLAPQGQSGQVPCWALQAQEEATPDVRDPLDWLLLTTDPLTTPQEAWQHLDWYVLRWRIEEFHKALKSGAEVEQRQFESRHNLEVAMAFMVLACVRCLALRDWAREEPERPAETVFSPEELSVLEAQAEHRRDPLEDGLTLAQAVRLIATMGGFLARKGDGEPGWQTLWKGYVCFRERLQGFRAALSRSAPLRQPLNQGPAP